MPMRRKIGISLACLVTSACAIAETPEESTTQSIGLTAGSAEMPTKSRSYTCRPQEHQPADYGSGPLEEERARFPPVADACDFVVDTCCGPDRAAGSRQFGKAAWYDFVGKKTASGELLDRITATAAHRSLPLASFAMVTNLDNGRSVIVKINDRGPYTRGRILDLSPRAADALDMKHAGVVAVVVEPLVSRADPIAAAF